MDSDLSLEFLRVVEQAAIACAHTMGQGDRHKSDQVAVEAMRKVMDTVPIDGTIVIGEGERDEAPMLYIGEKVGRPHAKGADMASHDRYDTVDIAVDPLEGTTLAAHGMPSALAVIALSARGTMFDPGPCVYMEKMAGSPEIADLLDLDRPLGETVKLVAERKGSAVGDVMVLVLDRPRHEEGIRAIRQAGARVRLIAHGDVSASLLAVTERSTVDLLWGIGGTPEGVISAAAVKCLGGQLLGRLWPRDDTERQAALDAGYDLQRVLTRDDLVSGEDVFFSATGITDGDVLQGVRYPSAGGATTESLVMRTRSGTIRRIRATHDRAKLAALRG
jgi:fructose-1,6-bisphosphatase II